VLHSPSIL